MCSALMRLVLLVPCFLVLFGYSRNATAEQSTSAPTSMPVVGGGWTAASICGALAWREGRLRDCSFQVSEVRSARGKKADSVGDWLATCDMDVKHKGDDIWID